MGQCRRRLARKAAGPRKEVNNARSKGCLQHSCTMGTSPRLPEGTQYQVNKSFVLSCMTLCLE